MKKIVLKSWSFVDVFETLMDLAREGRVDLSSPDFLRKIYETALRFGASEGLAARHFASATMAGDLIEASLGEMNSTWLPRRQVASQLIYVLAAEIQGYPHAANLDERQERSERFLMEFYEYGLSTPDAVLRDEIDYYERVLGVLFCLRVVTVLSEHPELSVAEIVRHALTKYRVSDERGRRVCYWCSGCPCVCGGRKGGKKAKHSSITLDMVWNRGLHEMDRHMTVYGVGRNSAIGPLFGVVRSASEDGGEYGWLDLMTRTNGTNEGIRDRQGCLYLAGTRHPRMATRMKWRECRSLRACTQRSLTRS